LKYDGLLEAIGMARYNKGATVNTSEQLPLPYQKPKTGTFFN
jgi:hypothetical protein